MLPRTFVAATDAAPGDPYFDDPSIRKLVGFFANKGLARLKEEDRAERWYDDWLAYQAEHRIYASVLSPRAYSKLGHEFDLLKLTRLLEAFGYCSAGHGYSLQVSFLGLFPILMGSNEELKREAVAALEAGGVFALGVSEKEHGSDLLGNAFSVTEVAPGHLLAEGGKYYIGNSNAAAMISILAGKADARSAGRTRRAPFVMFALRPSRSAGYRDVRKIRTLGVRQAYVGELEVVGHALPESDIFAEGRRAWDAVFGTITLGKFFLGIGSIGICQHALAEAAAHLDGRVLYGKPAIQLPHLRTAMAQALARLAAMKLYAYRALDYVHAAAATDRRYLLYCAVQKAKVSTEGVKVVSLLSECIGAKGFESDTYFETALRDVQLIPGLEGSTHINLGQAAQFVPQYFAGKEGSDVVPPASLLTGQATRGENPYLMEARTAAPKTVAFVDPFAAYRPLAKVPNVGRFVGQVEAYKRLVEHAAGAALLADAEGALLMGKVMAAIAYGQLVAENATLAGLPAPMIDAIFELFVGDLSGSAITLASFRGTDERGRALAHPMIDVPTCAADGWNLWAERVADFARAR